MSKIKISGTLNISAERAWERVIESSFILNMSRPIFKYKIMGETPLRFSEGDYQMVALGLNFVPIDFQRVRSHIDVNLALGSYCIRNISNGLPYSWDHQIMIKKIDENHSSFIDEIEISGRLKQLFIPITKMLFKQRQKNWAEEFPSL